MMTYGNEHIIKHAGLRRFTYIFGNSNIRTKNYVIMFKPYYLKICQLV